MIRYIKLLIIVLVLLTGIGFVIFFKGLISGKSLGNGYYYKSFDSDSNYIASKDADILLCPSIAKYVISSDKKYIAVKQVPNDNFKDVCPDQFTNSNQLKKLTAKNHRPVCNYYLIDTQQQIEHGPLTKEQFSKYHKYFSKKELQLLNGTNWSENVEWANHCS